VRWWQRAAEADREATVGGYVRPPEPLAVSPTTRGGDATTKANVTVVQRPRFLRVVGDDERAPTPRRELPREGQVLLFVTFVLVVFGQLMVYSASSAYALTNPDFGNDSLYFVKNGLLYTAAGVLLMLGLAFVPPTWVRRTAPIALVGTLVLLVAVLVPGVGLEINGAKRWLALGPITIQPSELAKVAVLLAVAAILTSRRPPQRLRDLLAPIGIIVAGFGGLIMLQPDLGTTLAIGLTVAALLLLAGTRVMLLVKALAISLIGVAGLIALEPYRRARILSFLDPWGQSQEGAYQVVQSMIAIGSGGVFGQGLGGSVQKVNFLPEAHTDMIFAVIGEELGLVGTVGTLALYAAFAWAGYTIAMRAVDPYQRLVAGGATALITGQAIINLGAVMGVLPLTGIPLPLISYGSSSRLVMLALVGVMLAISREPAPARVEPLTGRLASVRRRARAGTA
jgi:cell division protein FtsW